MLVLESDTEPNFFINFTINIVSLSDYWNLHLEMNWKNLKSLFVVDEGGSKKPVEPEKKKTPKKKGTATKGNTIIRAGEEKEEISTPPVTAPVTMGTVEKGEIKQAFVDHLLKAIESNNMDGIDYLEFKNTLQSFAKMPMDKNLRFQSALTAVKTMGASEQKILDSAQFYLDILAKEEASFNKAVERGKSQKIDGELQRIEQLKAQRQEKMQLIEKMKAEIEQISKEINGSSEKVMADQVKIETKRNHFYASYEFVVNQIKSDVSNLKKHTQSNNTTDNKA